MPAAADGVGHPCPRGVHSVDGPFHTRSSEQAALTYAVTATFLSAGIFALYIAEPTHPVI